VYFHETGNSSPEGSALAGTVTCIDAEEEENIDENDESHDLESVTRLKSPQKIIAINIINPATARIFENMPVFSATGFSAMPAIVAHIHHLSI